MNAAREYPRDYPYEFFFWCVGDIKEKIEGKKNFSQSLSKTSRGFIWSFLIFSFIYLFSFFVVFLVIRKKKINNNLERQGDE